MKNSQEDSIADIVLNSIQRFEVDYMTDEHPTNEEFILRFY